MDRFSRWEVIQSNSVVRVELDNSNVYLVSISSKSFGIVDTGLEKKLAIIRWYTNLL